MGWPQDIHDTLSHLAEIQEYERLWKAILLMYFPSKRGFRIGKYRESDGPRQKTLAVRKGLDIVVIVTYEPPCLLSQGHFSNNHSQFDLQAFKRPLVRLHSMGKIVAYMGLPFSGHEAPPHPDNWLYDLDEAGGINLIVECFSRVWTEIGLSREFSSHMPDIDNALDFLTEIPTRVRRGARGGAPPRSEDESATLAATDKHETNPVTPLGGHFQKAFSVDIVLMFTAYLEGPDLKSFSLVNSVCNDIADRRLWRNFRLAWTDRDPVWKLDGIFSVLTRNPRRAAYVRTLTVLCGWAWSTERLGQFRQIALNMLRLETFIFQALPLSGNHATGSEFTPLFRMLTAQASGFKFKLRRFSFEAYVRPSSNLLEFLRTQPQLERLDGLQIDERRPISIPTDVLHNLKHIQTGSIPSAIAWIEGRPIRTLELTPEHHAREPRRWGVPKALRPASSVLPVLDKLASASQHIVEGLTIYYDPTYATPAEGDLLIHITRACPRLRFLRLYGPMSLEKIPLLESLPRLELFGCAFPGWLGRGEEKIYAWLDLFPSHIKRVELFNSRKVCSRNDPDGKGSAPQVDTLSKNVAPLAKPNDAHGGVALYGSEVGAQAESHAEGASPLINTEWHIETVNSLNAELCM